MLALAVVVAADVAAADVAAVVVVSYSRIGMIRTEASHNRNAFA